MKNKIITLILNLTVSGFSFSMEQAEKEKLGQELIQATKYNQIERIKELIKDGADLNAKDNNGDTALILSASWNNKKIVELLINAGADVNTRDYGCRTPLILASEKNHKEIVEILIQAGADLNIKDTDDWTALYFGCFYGHKEIVELLIKTGANINTKNINGTTIFKRASMSGNKEIVELLKQAVNSWKQEVYNAIDNNNFENFKKYLLRIGTINFRDKNGNNLLHYAMIHGNLEFTKLIFAIYPELVAQINNEGQTPFSFIGAYGEFIILFKTLFISETRKENCNK